MRMPGLGVMRLIFAGTPEAAVPSLEALAASGHEIAAVVTRPPAPLGRKRVLTPSPVEATARTPEASSSGAAVVSTRSLSLGGRTTHPRKA